MGTGFREETLEPNEGHQSPEARPQHFCRRKWRSPHQSLQGISFAPFTLLKRRFLGLNISFFVLTGLGTAQWPNPRFLQRYTFFFSSTPFSSWCVIWIFMSVGLLGGEGNKGGEINVRLVAARVDLCLQWA